MEDARALARVTAARVARLATREPDGRPHLVPVVFVLDGRTLYSAVDAKPKRSRMLRRVENARERPDEHRGPLLHGGHRTIQPRGAPTRSRSGLRCASLESAA